MNMHYRYDPLQFNCESFVYARTRAATFYRYHKKRFNGDLEDLEQIAVMAVVEAMAAVEDKTVVAEDVLLKVVDQSLARAIKVSRRQSPITAGNIKNDDGEPLELQNLICQAPESRLATMSEIKLRDFRKKLDSLLPEEYRDLLWDILVLDMTIEEKCEKIIATQVGKGKWLKPTPEKLKRLLKEAISAVRLKISSTAIEGIIKLPPLREPI